MDFTEEATPVITIESIRAKLTEVVGSRIKLHANLGRSRVLECEGDLVQAHPHHFIMELEKRRGKISRASYEYADILTGMVELSDIDSGQLLFPVCARV
ncbi:MAG: Veg family protein [Coriobacteriales bacterium]|nr:Veg family protein [Coriobacteriales bacterium]